MSEPTPEFSREIAIARISPSGIIEELDAKPAERTALAARFDLLELPALTAQLTLKPSGQETIFVKGKIIADIVQRCVVTLEPMSTHIDLAVDTVFLPAEQHRVGAGSSHYDELDDEFEIFSNGKIDLGEMVAQHLGVTIDPYPRKAGAELPATEFGAKVEERKPFAELVKGGKDE